MGSDSDAGKIPYLDLADNRIFDRLSDGVLRSILHSRQSSRLRKNA
jgi:hypothetical protein